MARTTPLANSAQPVRTFQLGRENRKIFGVCSGIANYFGIDALLVRVGFVAAVLMFGLPLILYFVIALVAD